jgi:hypothetical protein
MHFSLHQLLLKRLSSPENKKLLEYRHIAKAGRSLPEMPTTLMRDEWTLGVKSDLSIQRALLDT